MGGNEEVKRGGDEGIRDGIEEACDKKDEEIRHGTEDGVIMDGVIRDGMIRDGVIRDGVISTR